MIDKREATRAEIDPLVIDLARLQSQQRARAWLVQTLASILTFGLWLPFAIYILANTYGEEARAEASRYRVRVGRGVLEVGSERVSATVPLDQIVSVSLNEGYVNVGLRSGKPLEIFGLRDPRAAAAAILAARGAHLRVPGGPRERRADESDSDVA